MIHLTSSGDTVLFDSQHREIEIGRKPTCDEMMLKRGRISIHNLKNRISIILFFFWLIFVLFTSMNEYRARGLTSSLGSLLCVGVVRLSSLLLLSLNLHCMY